MKCYHGIKKENGEGKRVEKECSDGVTQCVKGPRDSIPEIYSLAGKMIRYTALSTYLDENIY